LLDLEYEWFKKKIQGLAGIDLSDYRPEQMKRLVKKIMDSWGARSYVDLYRKLEADPARVQDFKAQVTINVSYLFRDMSRWRHLEELLREQVREKPPDKTSGAAGIRAWSAGCSIGAEPYSLAILLEEFASEPGFPGFSYRIFCSDIDPDMIRRGMDGVFTDKELKETPEEYVKKYFNPIERPALPWSQKSTAREFFRVVPPIRANLRFRNENIVDSTYEEAFDLVVCRNVMIYFNDDVKKGLFRNFNRAVTDGGLLFIGATEVIFNPVDFGFEGAAPGIYRKVAHV